MRIFLNENKANDKLITVNGVVNMREKLRTFTQ